jgi:hypothetical protein
VREGPEAAADRRVPGTLPQMGARRRVWVYSPWTTESVIHPGAATVCLRMRDALAPTTTDNGNALYIGGRVAGVAAILNVVYRAALRSHLAAWGASDEERRARLLGDDILPVDGPTSTMGTTIGALRRQSGHGWVRWAAGVRGGKPRPARHGGRPSAER